jgi:PAS domain S-box-containing protein
MPPQDPSATDAPHEDGQPQWRVAREQELLDALHSTEAGFRQFIDRCPDAIFVRRGTAMVHVNDALLALLGFERSEVLGRDPVEAFVHPDHRAEVLEHRDLRPEDTDLRESTWVCKDGSLVVVETVGVTVTFEGAKARIAMSRNVTMRRRLQEKLFLAGHMATVGTLAAGIAHEINNPLSGVMANVRLAAEMLKSSGGGTEEVCEMLADALEAAERVRRIVDGMRTFARLDDERRARLELPRVIGTALALAMNEVRTRAQIVTDLQQVPPVTANEGRLVQVLVNLLVNAAHAIPEGRAARNEIRVGTRTDRSGRAVVTIGDTGEGIPPDRLARIFDPFYTTRSAGMGAGLGLSISRNIVSGIGGEILVDSKVGAGTTFTVLLPPASP